MENEPDPSAPLSPPPHFVVVAVLFEGALAVVAVGLGWLFGHAPGSTFRPDWAGLGWGIVATGPLLVGLWGIVRTPWEPLRQIVRVVDETLAPMFRDAGLADLAAIAVVAGVGEEMLFRGLIQGGLAVWIGGPEGVWIGLAAGSVIFGLFHPITRAYAVMAGLIGLYLGWLWIISGNLLVPITTHAVYDFAALVYLIRYRRSELEEVGSEDEL
ncbi:MAG: CPBP family intramembrane metalloprotease [Pirellulales bacterium]|nr:CPBP family intramembrane metalloprotease [Pirellulales bacterium]